MQVIFLPEACDYIAGNKTQTVEMAESINGPTVEAYKELAKQFKVWLSLGGIHIKVTFKLHCNQLAVGNIEWSLIHLKMTFFAGG